LLRPGVVDTLGTEMATLGCERVMVVCGGNTRKSRLFERVMAALGPRAITVYDQVVEHSSVDMVTHGAELARELRVDGLLAVGGGSASDTAKAIAILLGEGGRLEEHASRFIPPDQFFPKPLPAPKLPLAAVVTTASAAEVTPGLGVRDANGAKLLFTDPQLASRVVLLDPQANLQVPASLMLSTGMNGVAHCIEGLYSLERSPLAELVALDALQRFAQALPAMHANPLDLDARAQLLYAAHLSGLVLVNARTALHHAVCHAIGSVTGAPHGQANAVLLPHALAFNRPHVVQALQRASAVLPGGQDVVAWVARTSAALGVPTRLRDIGVAQDALAVIAQKTMGERGLYFNPRPVSHASEILALLQQAY
jgi:alcohol dehydrogenase